MGNPMVFPLQDNWPYAVSVLADRVARRVGAVVAANSALNLSQWRVLAAVAEQPGRMAREVVAITPMDKGLVSRAVARLVELGLMERRRSDSDGRAAHLHLTEAGQAAFDTIITALRAADATGEDLRGGQVLNAALSAMIARYDALPPLPPAGDKP